MSPFKTDSAISINAPVKSATRITQVDIRKAKISINAPVKSATKQRFEAIVNSDNFNQRTREECDCSPSQKNQQGGDFNQRTREECDFFMRKLIKRARKWGFQSTHP